MNDENTNPRPGFNPNKSVDPARRKTPEDLAGFIYHTCAVAANQDGMSFYEILGAIEAVKIQLAKNCETKK